MTIIGQATNAQTWAFQKIGRAASMTGAGVAQGTGTLLGQGRDAKSQDYGYKEQEALQQMQEDSTRKQQDQGGVSQGQQLMKQVADNEYSAKRGILQN